MPDPIPEAQELRQVILKASLVKSAVQRWEKVPGEPVKTSHQKVIEIGIDDLLALIAADKQRAVWKARIDEIEHLPNANMIVHAYKIRRRAELQSHQEKEKR